MKKQGKSDESKVMCTSYKFQSGHLFIPEKFISSCCDVLILLWADVEELAVVSQSCEERSHSPVEERH